MAPPRFAADAMLGRLVRWLRALGFDTSYDTSLADAALLWLANEEGRILLTRDRHLLRELRPASALEITKDAPLEQLQDLVAALALQAPVELFSRCLLCNSVLSPPLGPEETELVLPPGVSEVPEPVRQCPSCGHVYWNGSHVRRMRVTLERTLPGWVG